MSSFAVLTESLCKRYGAMTVLDHVNLRVPTGALFGFLGPNGAGKTTTIRILMGLLQASSGAARLLGEEAWRAGPRVRARVGYLPGDVRFYDHLSGRRMLLFLNRARGGGERGRAEIARLAEKFELDIDKRIRRYSRGMKQKLGLIAALLHRPELLILDEPTTALDPLVRVRVFEELRSVARAGRTVLFSSHTLSEVEELCDEVAILRDGRLVEHGRIEDLRRRALRGVEITFGGAPPGDVPAGLRVARREERWWKCAWRGEVEPLLAWLAQQAVRDVVIAPPDLEDLFLAYYEHNAPNAGELEPAGQPEGVRA